MCSLWLNVHQRAVAFSAALLYTLIKSHANYNRLLQNNHNFLWMHHTRQPELSILFAQNCCFIILIQTICQTLVSVLIFKLDCKFNITLAGAAVCKSDALIVGKCHHHKISRVWCVTAKKPLLHMMSECLSRVCHRVVDGFSCVNFSLCLEAGRSHPAPRGCQTAPTFHRRTDQTTRPVTAHQNLQPLRTGDWN